jgi:putative PIN family toxin of toxin-antitoxin system
MGTTARVTPLRTVLDTNVVAAALLFAGGRMVWLRVAWQAGRIVPLGSRETVRELLRVLGYPKFRLTATEREELLADYLPYVETVALPEAGEPLPECRDRADLPFLALARAANADALVTGDEDLLALAGQFAVPILTPAELRQRLTGAETAEGA